MEEGSAHCPRPISALCRILCKGAIDDFADRLRDVRTSLSQGNWWLFEDCADGVVDAAVPAQIDREFAGQQTVRRHTNRVNVRLRFDVAKIAQLLRRHVCECPGHLAGHSYAAHDGVSKTLCETKVG